VTETFIAAIIVGSIGAVAAAFAAIRVARRQNSGQISNSDANTLWNASEQMRKELRDEVVELRAQAVLLLAKIDNLEKRLAKYEPGS
jgi:MFS superfamily sulfate permease-like transporter